MIAQERRRGNALADFCVLQLKSSRICSDSGHEAGEGSIHYISGQDPLVIWK